MGVLTRRVVLALALAAVAACSPEIVAGTYFCGPERLCPPNLVCDELAFTCETPSLARRFSCPADGARFEPDDARESAHDLGPVVCGQSPLDLSSGCIDDDADTDVLRFDVTTDLADACEGTDPHIEVTLRFPVAFVPLTLVLVDADGEPVAEPGECSVGGDFGGMAALCVDVAPSAGSYFVEIGSASAGDCEGDCHFNHYALSIDFLLN